MKNGHAQFEWAFGEVRRDGRRLVSVSYDGEELHRDILDVNQEYHRRGFLERVTANAPYTALPYSPDSGFAGAARWLDSELLKAAREVESDSLLIGGDSKLIASLAEDHERTEVCNARRLVALKGEEIRHEPFWNRWLVYDGTRWATDYEGKLEQFAKEVHDQLWRQVPALAMELDPKDMQKPIRFVTAMGTNRGIRATVDLARTEPGIPVSHEQLDRDPWLLNVVNGTIDLKTATIRDHDRADMITKRAPVKFDPDADCPLWLKTLTRCFAGDAELIAYFRRAVGFTITGSCAEHVLFFCYGLGANGKSLVLGTLQKLLGEDYAMKAPPDLLLEKQGTTHPVERADLYRKRMVSCIEIEGGRRMAEGLVKELTGNDKIRARRLYENFWEFSPTHKLWLAANHRPVVRGTDCGIWRRLKLIPFTVTIPPHEQDHDLPEKLEAELSGILNWALIGCLEWQENGLCEPSVVNEATAEYRDDSDVVGHFLDEHCLFDHGKTVKASDLRRHYEDWCKTNGEHPVSNRRLGDALTERGVTKRKSNGVWYQGLDLA